MQLKNAVPAQVQRTAAPTNGFELKKAQRSRVKLKIGITAPSGGGKTFSALQLAAGLCGGDWEKIAIIDTERSADLYADHPKCGAYNVLHFDPPHDADRYVAAINAAVNAGMEVVVIDSLTHFWNWVLEYQGKLGGRFQDWAKANPVYQRVIDAILLCPIHVIVTTRRKTEYELSNEGGKNKVMKVGLKQEFRDSFEYELSIVFGLNQSHLASIEKDRTGIFSDKPDFLISADTGKMLLEWTNSGVAPPRPSPDAVKAPAAYSKDDPKVIERLEKELAKDDCMFIRDKVLDILDGQPMAPGAMAKAIEQALTLEEHSG